MWIDRKTYDDLRLDRTTWLAEARTLTTQNQALTTTLDWLRVRVTQLELERAQLLWNYTGVKVPTPTITHTATDTVPLTPPNFQDIGDAEAAKQGIEWADDGTLLYTK